MASPKRKAFPLRIDPRLWAEIEAWAQQEFRSVNGQIEYLLREAVLRRNRKANLGPDGGGQDANNDEST
jgi:hypothetical protein